MRVPADEVRRIARLARLHVGEDETSKVAEELSAILDHMQVLRESDLPNDQPTDLAPQLREDLVDDGRTVNAAAIAPRAQDGFIVVPRLHSHKSAGELGA